jgi:hypothetical protein
MTSSEPKQHVPDVWEVAFAWCPPQSSPMLGPKDSNPGGVANHPGTKARRRLRFRANKQPGDAPN